MLDQDTHKPTTSADGIERLRSAIADADPAMLNSSDVSALIGLISDALESDSDWAKHVRADDAERMQRAADREAAEAGKVSSEVAAYRAVAASYVFHSRADLDQDGAYALVDRLANGSDQ